MKSSMGQSAVHKAQHFFGVEFANEITKHAENYEHLLDQFVKAVAAGHPSGARKAQHLLLHSYSAKMVSIVRCLDQNSGLSAEAVREIAAGLDLYKDCEEEIDCWAEPKGSGGWRPICSFGLKRQAIHRLIVDILRARFGIDDINYLAKGSRLSRMRCRPWR
jgi:RNA-directed DNA polymerase